MSDKSWGLVALQYWYKAAFHPFTWTQAQDYYNRLQPSFLEKFGNAVRGVSLDRVEAAMKKVALTDTSGYPAVGDFWDALAEEAKTLNSDDYKNIAANTVKDVAGVATGMIGTYIVVIAVIAGLALFGPRLVKGFA